MSEGSVYELAINGMCLSNQIVNTFGFVQKSTTAGFLGAGLITDWNTNMKAPWLAMIDGQYYIDVYRVTDVVPAIAARAELYLTAANVGTAGVATAPNTVAAVLSWSTARSGRSYRGRTYVAPVPGTYHSRNTVVTAGITAYNAFISAFLARYGPAGSSTDFQAAIISRVQNGVELTQPVATPITAGTLRLTLGTQRRRRLGVGS